MSIREEIGDGKRNYIVLPSLCSKMLSFSLDGIFRTTVGVFVLIFGICVNVTDMSKNKLVQFS
jgi:hypothetical protein